MTVDLQRRRVRSRRRSLEFAGLSLVCCLLAGVLIGAGVGVGAWLIFLVATMGMYTPWWPEVLAAPVLGGVISVAAYVPILVQAAFRSPATVLRRAHAETVDDHATRRLHHVLEEVSVAAGLPCPAAAVITDPFPNAMTAGRGPHDATVVVTTGLLGWLDRQELQAVVAHEIAHILDGDLRAMTFLATCTARFRAVTSFLFDTYKWSIFGLLAWPTAGLADYCLRLSNRELSRERELLADDTAVLLTRDPRALAEALVKIGSAAATPQDWKADITPLFIVDPKHVWSGKESVPLRERVDRLRALMPRHEPQARSRGDDQSRAVNGAAAAAADVAGPAS